MGNNIVYTILYTLFSILFRVERHAYVLNSTCSVRPVLTRPTTDGPSQARGVVSDTDSVLRQVCYYVYTVLPQCKSKTSSSCRFTGNRNEQIHTTRLPDYVALDDSMTTILKMKLKWIHNCNGNAMMQPFTMVHTILLLLVIVEMSKDLHTEGHF